MRPETYAFPQVKWRFWVFSQVVELWAHVDLNHGPHPYQGCALTGLSYGPSNGESYKPNSKREKSNLPTAAPLESCRSTLAGKSGPYDAGTV